MSTEAPLALGRFPVQLTLPVQWGDMDAFAHVNNVMYLRWFESARIAYLEKLAITARWAETGLRPILARASVDYRLPVTYPDTVTLEATVTKIGQTSLVMAYRARSHQQAQAVVAEGEAVVVLLDGATGQKAPVPPLLRSSILALEGVG